MSDPRNPKLIILLCTVKMFSFCLESETEVIWMFRFWNVWLFGSCEAASDAAPVAPTPPARVSCRFLRQTAAVSPPAFFCLCTSVKLSGFLQPGFLFALPLRCTVAPSSASFSPRPLLVLISEHESDGTLPACCKCVRVVWSTWVLGRRPPRF